jgi:multiple sugar transport system permease protein
MKQESLCQRLGSHAVLMVGAVFMLFPFVWMFFTAFKAPGEIFNASLSPACLVRLGPF